MLIDLKRSVCKANKELARHGVAKFTWGNLSAFDPSMGLFVIKPRDVPFEDLQPEMMVVMSLDGQKVEGRLEPSSDAETHRAMYCAWAMQIVSIAHVYSPFATAFSQAGLPLKTCGIRQIDLFGGDVPCTPKLTIDEIGEDYRYSVGQSIVDTIGDPKSISSVLVNQNSPFSWGQSPMEAVKKIVMLEEIAKFAYYAHRLNPNSDVISQEYIDKVTHNRKSY